MPSRTARALPRGLVRTFTTATMGALNPYFTRPFQLFFALVRSSRSTFREFTVRKWPKFSE